VLIPVGKWQEIVEHIENRPKSWILKADALAEQLQKPYEDWLEVLEAKVAELKEPSK